jgi:hypothetical protein
MTNPMPGRATPPDQPGWSVGIMIVAVLFLLAVFLFYYYVR